MNSAAIEIVDLGIEQNRLDALGFRDKARQFRFDPILKAGELDQIAHQGTTSPAAISSARGARPSIALRCGKRPKRSITSWCFFAKPSCYSSPSAVNSSSERCWSAQILAVLERHVEEAALLRFAVHRRTLRRPPSLAIASAR